MIINNKLRMTLVLISYLLSVVIAAILIVGFVSDFVHTQPYCILISISIAIIGDVIIKIIIDKTGLFRKILDFLKIS